MTRKSSSLRTAALAVLIVGCAASPPAPASPASESSAPTSTLPSASAAIVTPLAVPTPVATPSPVRTPEASVPPSAGPTASALASIPRTEATYSPMPGWGTFVAASIGSRLDLPPAWVVADPTARLDDALPRSMMAEFERSEPGRFRSLQFDVIRLRTNGGPFGTDAMVAYDPASHVYLTVRAGDPYRSAVLDELLAKANGLDASTVQRIDTDAATILGGRLPIGPWVWHLRLTDGRLLELAFLGDAAALSRLTDDERQVAISVRPLLAADGKPLWRPSRTSLTPQPVDAALAAMIPATIGGVDTKAISSSGESVVGNAFGFARDGMFGLLGMVIDAPGEVTTATGFAKPEGHESIVIAASRIENVKSSELEAAVRRWFGDGRKSQRMEGKDVYVGFVDGVAESYLMVSGDVYFLVSTRDPELAREAIRKLP